MFPPTNSLVVPIAAFVIPAGENVGVVDDFADHDVVNTRTASQGRIANHPEDDVVAIARVSIEWNRVFRVIGLVGMYALYELVG